MVEIRHRDGRTFSTATADRAEDVREAIEAAVSRRVDLSGADLDGADLKASMNLEEAKLVAGANLTRANLRGANLEEVDLSGASLVDAHLDGANLERADLDAAPPWWGRPLRGANLEEGAKLPRRRTCRARTSMA